MRGGRNRVLVGDVRERLAELPEQSVDCVITSPPYFQLRDYGIGGQIGLEENVDVWVDELHVALSGLKRVLKPSGSLWLNLGDTYSRHPKYGAPAKSLLLAPERLLIALASDGWLVRNKVVWAKTNPMPHSVGDRLSNTYDVVYFLTRQPRYFFDLDAIRLPHRSSRQQRRGRDWPPEAASAPLWRQRGAGNRGLSAQKARGEVGHPLGKNPGDVWTLASASYRGAHFATFPEQLVERPLLATCPELICERCEVPYKRAARARRADVRARRGGPQRTERRVLRYRERYTVIRERGPLLPACSCAAGARPGMVLDPFLGSGTVAAVAVKHRRDWLGIELNPDYAALAEQRVERARDRWSNGARNERVLRAAQPSDLPERRGEP